MSPSLTWPKPWPPSSGGEVRGPQAALLDLAPAAARSRRSSCSLREVVGDRLERPDLLADELAHPVELRLELGLGREVPRHAGAASRIGSGSRSGFAHYAGSPCAMRVVVTGATGNVGTALLRALAAEDRVERGRRHRPPAAGVDRAEGDLGAGGRRPRRPRARCSRGADCVVHLAWLIQPSRDEPVTYATNVRGQRRACSRPPAAPACRRSCTPRRSAPTRPVPKDRFVDESWADDRRADVVLLAPQGGGRARASTRFEARAPRGARRAAAAGPDLPARRRHRDPAAVRRAVPAERARAARARAGRARATRGCACRRSHADDVADAYRRAIVSRRRARRVQHRRRPGDRRRPARRAARRAPGARPRAACSARAPR